MVNGFMGRFKFARGWLILTGPSITWISRKAAIRDDPALPGALATLATQCPRCGQVFCASLRAKELESVIEESEARYGYMSEHYGAD